MDAKEFEALARDAARYRWLEANCINYPLNPEMRGTEVIFRYDGVFNEPQLGYAIDCRIMWATEAALGASDE